MAYATGTVIGGSQLLSALTSFMATNGWTLVDTVAADDLVYSSSGTSGKFPMIMRLTLSTSTNNPWAKCLYDPATVEPGLFVRGYHTWNVGGHSGTGEYGVMGPLLVAGDQSDGGPSNRTGWKAYRIDSSTGATGFPYQTTANDGYLIPNTTWCSNRKCVNRTFMGTWQADGSAVAWVMDAITGDSAACASIPWGSRVTYQAHELVYQPATDKWFSYHLTADNTSASHVLLKYDLEANVWSIVANVPWSLTNQANAGGWLCWDGVNTIYMIPSSVGTIFYKYTISSGAFTSLATLPIARHSDFRDNFGSANNFFYLPATVSGYSSDVILTVLNQPGTTFYCYNISTNTWNDSANGTPNLTLPATFGNSPSIVWDHQRYAYFCNRASSSFLYRMDLTNIVGGWTNLGYVFDTSTSYNTQNIWNSPAGRVRHAGSLDSTTYWITGDNDHVILVTKNVTNSKYYWLYFGRYQSRRRSAIMTITAPVTSGFRVSIPVDDSAAYVAGDTVLIFDAATGNLEGTAIYSVPDGTHVVATLANSYGTGSIAGTDPMQTVITGDSGIAVTPSDPKGYKTDLEPAWYKLLEYGTTSNFLTSAADGLSYIQPMEAGMVLGYWSSAYQYTNNNNPLSRTGLLGSPMGVYFLYGKGWPYTWPEDLIKSNGDQYKAFPQSNYNPLLANQRWIVVGPIN